MGLQEDAQAAVAAATIVLNDVNAQTPSLAEQVLAAITPVLEAAGYIAPTVTSEPELPASE